MWCRWIDGQKGIKGVVREALKEVLERIKEIDWGFGKGFEVPVIDDLDDNSTDESEGESELGSKYELLLDQLTRTSIHRIYK